MNNESMCTKIRQNLVNCTWAVKKENPKCAETAVKEYYYSWVQYCFQGSNKEKDIKEKW